MSQAVEQGTLYVISAPSGAGKTSLVAEMLRND
jgi:guanylate kinase